MSTAATPAPAPAGGGAWEGRPAGLPGAVPPPSVPLSFLAASAVGLVGCGVAWVWVSGTAASDPTADPVVAAVHIGVLATLSMGVLGATHQFTPVITARPLRSVRLARATFASWLAAAWMLPLGIATEQVGVTAASGAMAGLAVVLLAVNLAGPLSVRGKGASVTALRVGVSGALLTGFLGAAFVGDRQGNWFALSGHVDVAMGVLGLFGWLGVTYVGVAEKLWPMFMLAHVPGRRLPGRLGVWGVGLGAVLLAPGLAWSVMGVAVPGAGILTAGLGCHLVSLGMHVRHRRRKADLHLAYLVTAAAWLPVAAGLCLAAVLVLPTDHHAGAALAAAGVAAAAGWLLEALVGHAHKVVPFIAWSALRARGVKDGPAGKPLMFADLYDRRWAAVAYASVTLGVAALCAGLAASMPELTVLSGVVLSICGVVVAVNLSAIPWRMLRARATPEPSHVLARGAGPAHASAPAPTPTPTPTARRRADRPRGGRGSAATS